MLEAAEVATSMAIVAEQTAVAVVETGGQTEGDVEAAAGRCKSNTKPPRSKVKGLKLLAHEQALLDAGELRDITHIGASSIWLSAPSADQHVHGLEERCLVYRPMGDRECIFLLQHGTLPNSQPYQTIVRGDEGRRYAEKYLRGHKQVDSSPTTVVEFTMPSALVERLFEMQSKNEDGAISHGLGDKGGKGLPLVNASLDCGESTYRIVLVKRFHVRDLKPFGSVRKRDM
jgi:hypothetical protein